MSIICLPFLSDWYYLALSSAEKSTFGVNQVDFLGYQLSAAGLLRNGKLLSLVHTKLWRDHVSLIRPAKEGY